MAVDRKYYSPSEVADMLGVTERTVRQWIADDEVPHRRMGPKLVRIPAEWVEADTDEEAAEASV